MFFSEQSSTVTIAGGHTAAIANWEIGIDENYTIIAIRGARVSHTSVGVIYAYMSSGNKANVRLYNYLTQSVDTKVTLQFIAINGTKYHIWL